MYQANNQLFVLLVGHNASGKTTLARQLAEDLNLQLVEGDPFRMFLAAEIPYFKDLDISIPNPKARIASQLTHDYRHMLARKLLKADQAVLYGGGNLKRDVRAHIFEKICNGIATRRVILYCKIDEGTLLGRFAERERNDSKSRWTEHYFRYRKPQLEEPAADECDELIVYDQQNYEEVRDRLKRLLTR